MPLKRYGVLRAAVIDRRIETTDTPHYQIHLRAAGVDYRAAVNVRSQQSPPDLLYLGLDRFQHPVTDKLRDLPDGFNELESRSGGTALDYIRGNLFQREQMRPVPTAAPGPENDLGDFLDHYVQRALGDPGARAYVFGEAWGPEQNKPDKIFGFAPGNGVHDVHMNQGNAGQFAGDNGVHQDGALLLHFPAADDWVAVFLAFQSQVFHTDDITGHPLSTVPHPGPGPGPSEPDHLIRIVAALVNPVGPAPEPETVTLLNASPAEIDLTGWSLVSPTTQPVSRQPLEGRLGAGAIVQVHLTPPAALGNRGGTLTLLDADGLKVDGVAWTADQGRREGWTVVF
ncbi:DUF2278 family protein [Actinoplanes sp. GCM10030250]|uniref:DUF2278 family protein n=1 Tax=Actinoplanes sp. GCM10030250 TaxID=3273376 RepID=UPI00361E84C4